MSRADLLVRMVPAMQRELHANAFKGDTWANDDPVVLSRDVLYHCAKLHLAVLNGDQEAIKELGADVANCAAILADATGALDVELPEVVEDLDYETASQLNGGMYYGGKELRQAVEEIAGQISTFRPDPRDAEVAA